MGVPPPYDGTLGGGGVGGGHCLMRIRMRMLMLCRLILEKKNISIFLQFGAFLSYDDFFVVVQWICISIVFVCPSSIIQFGIFVIPLPLLQ